MGYLRRTVRDLTTAVEDAECLTEADDATLEWLRARGDALADTLREIDDASAES